MPTFVTLVVVGRIGCALSGLEDQTYGILRHPVAAYESLTMAGFWPSASSRWPVGPRFSWPTVFA